jgi:autotransporter-associated beta strand protein
MRRASLNHAYRLVWSHIHAAFVPVPEWASGRGKSGRTGGVVALAAGALLALGAGTAQAADTWTGGAGNGSWSAGGNWLDGSPPVGGDLIFPGSVQLESINDIGSLSLSALRFDLEAGAYTLSGQPIDLWSGIVNSSGNLQTLAFSQLIVKASQSWDAGSGGLSVSAPVVLDNSAGNVTLMVGGQGDSTVSGAISETSGSGSLTYSGSGTLTLSGNNSYSGATLINAGTLVANGGSAIGDLSAVTVASGTTLGVGAAETIGSLAGAGNVTLGTNTLTTGGNNANTAFSGAISGAGGLTKAGTGTLTLTGNNIYTGGTSINGGTLQIGSGGTAGSISGNVVDNGTLVFNRSSPATFAGNISGSGSLVQAGTGMLTLTGTNTYTGGTTINTGRTLRIGNGFTTGSISGNVANSGMLQFDRSDAVSFAGNISGAGGLVKWGFDTLTLSGNNTYSGTTTLNSGTLQANGGNAIGDSSAVGVFSGATLALGANETIGSLNGTANVNSGGFTLTTGGNNTGTTFSGVISGTGGLTKTGTGTMTLAGANTYTGGTTINGGVLQIGSGSTTGSIAGNVVDNGMLVFNRSDAVVFNGNISGAGTLRKIGTGTLTLSGSNSYSGATLIDSGTLQVSSGAAIDDLSKVQMAAGATLALGANETVGSLEGFGSVNTGGFTLTTGGNNSSTPFTGQISGSGGLTKAGNGVLQLGGTNTYSGATTIIAGIVIANGGSAIGDLSAVDVGFDTELLLGGNEVIGSLAGAGNVNLGGFTLTAGGNNTSTTYSGVISGSGGLTKAGTGTLTLSGSNTYSGFTSILGGTLLANGGAALSNLSTVDVSAGAMLVLGAAETIGALHGAGSVDNGGFTLTTGGNNSGRIFSGVMSGSGGLIKIGSGTQVLSGNNTYSGLTTISAGTLQLGNGGTTGSVAGDVVNNGRLQFARSNATTFDGDISGSGSLWKSLSNTLTLSGNNTYTGATDVFGGTLVAAGGSAIGDSSAVTVWAGATLVLGADETIRSLSGGGNVDNGGFTLSTGGSSFAFSGVLSGSGGLVKTAFGRLTLTGVNTYTGGTTINGGTLEIGDGGTSGSIAGDVVDNGTLTFNRSDNITFAGNISGTGGLTQAGAGTLALSGSNSYSGATSINAGTLQADGGAAIGDASAVSVSGGATLALGADETVGSLAGAGSVDNGGFALTAGGNNASTSFSGVISGSGGLTKIGTGTMTLGGANTYTGATNIDAGTLQANGGAAIADSSAVSIASSATLALGAAETIGSLAGAGNVNLGANMLTTGGDNSDTTFSGVISGAGNLTQTGTGTLTLTGDNTYTGGTTIDSGTLVVGDGATSGSIVGDVLTNGLLTFNRSDTYTFAGDISGSGGVEMAGSGRLTLTGDNSYSGGTTVSSGTLVIGSLTALGANTSLTVVAGASLEMGVAGDLGSLSGGGDLSNGGFTLTTGSDNSDTTFSGVLSGSGGLTKTGTGTQTLTGDNTYTGTTTIGSGTLAIGDGGTSGAIVGDIDNNSALQFNRSDSLTYGGNISGAGSLTQAGSGTLTLTGDNSYSGGTTISSGTLQLGDGGSSGAIVGDVVDNGVLRFNRSDLFTFDGVISGAGSVEMVGSGHLVLNGVNTYSGGTTLSAGLLEIGDINHTGASLASDVLLTGGVLRGHGTINGALNNLSGTVFPGGSIGILTVAGNYTQGPGGTLKIEVTPNATAGIGYDQLYVTGSASLDGALGIVVGAGTYTAGTVYDIVHADGGITGTFASTSYNPAFAAYITPEVSYGANDVYLTLNPTQRAYDTGNTVLQQLFTVNHMTRGVLDVLASNAPSADLAKPLTGVWLQGFGGSGEVSGFDTSNGGVMLGAGSQVNDALLLGVAVAGADARTNDDVTLVEGRSLAGYAYGLYATGNWRLHAAVGLGQLDTESERRLSTVNLVATGKSEGNFNGVNVGGRYHVALGGSFVEPYVGASHMHSKVDGYQETGAGLLNIRYGDETQDLGTLEAGVRVGMQVPMAAVALVPWARLGGTRYLGDTTVRNAEAVGVVDNAQSLETVRHAAADLGAGVEVGGQGSWRGGLSWNGQRGDRLSLDSVKAEIQYQW